jgi:L-ribulose-5-phosphate 4-epimerase
MTITDKSQQLDGPVLAFVEQATAQAEQAFRVFRETGTITANGTVGFVERVPGHPDTVVILNDPGPWADDRSVRPSVATLDGTVLLGPGGAAGGALRFAPIFKARAEITTVSHVHTPHLGAWSQTQRTLPITYVPVQRHTLARELPIYIDRRQDEAQFIVEQLTENPHLFAILEANGGSTVWGRQGLQATAEVILLLEEGARLQILAEAIGGSRPFGPGVLAQQWKMGGLTAQAEALGLLP